MTEQFVAQVEARFARPFAAAVQDMLVAMARENKPALLDARTAIEGLVRQTMGIGEVFGAQQMLRRAAGILSDGATRSERTLLRADFDSLLTFKEPGSYGLPTATFEEAVQEMVLRTPTALRDAAERTAIRISKLYSEGRVVAFARSAEVAVTKRVQELIVQSLREGMGEGETAQKVRMEVERIREKTELWSEAYSRMAIRTNVNTAVTAGRFRQAQDPAVREVVPAFRFDSVGDGDTRDNHNAADGLIFRVDNPIWNRIAPPLGYNCRCQVSLVTVPQLRRMGRLNKDGSVIEDRLPAGAFPDDGFRHGGRPDLFIVGVA